ncbi:BAR domain-containing protein [Salix suchowensis]|nr:BAR domain-containing protein [Salix suchowensis]
MDTQQSWRVRLSFKNATIFMTLLNTVTALFLIQGFLSSPSTRNSKLSPDHSNSGMHLSIYLSLEILIYFKLSYIKESEEMRLAVQPWKLIKRVKEIEQDGHAEPETVQQKDTRQTAAAVDLSKRLQDFRSLNNASTLKALEEWRKRKMERARQ